MALNPLVSVIGRLVARSGRKRGNRQTDGIRNDKTTTVTLAAHARRGWQQYGFYRKGSTFDTTTHLAIIIVIVAMTSLSVQTKRHRNKG